MRRAWTVSPTAAPAATKLQAAPAATQWLKVHVDAAGHQVLGRQATVPHADLGTTATASHWQYQLLDEHGAELAAGAIVDPRVARSTLSAPGQPHAGHGMALLDAGVYYVGIPQGAEARKLRIAASAAGREKLAGTGSVPAGAIELTLDPP
jgi:hypothetical protein